MATQGYSEFEPVEFEVVQDYLLKKATAEGDKIIKVKKEKGAKLATTGKLFVGGAGGKWVQERKADGEGGGWFLVFGPGFNLKEPLLVHPSMEFAELGAPRGKPMKLTVMSPVEAGEHLLDLSIEDNWTIGQVKALLCQQTGLKPKSMIMAKGKAGERVPEDAKLDDSQSVTDVGYKDGDEIAFIYLGTLETDLEAFLAAKK
mmetsp:Transcript_76546/g.197140  ORF Transcript_76546/g.197140 Transcript_76546/m.197140 type:complete len:202 (-) Transcript_76546:121-726(-)